MLNFYRLSSPVICHLGGERGSPLKVTEGFDNETFTWTSTAVKIAKVATA